MDAALQAELLALFVNVLTEVRRRVRSVAPAYGENCTATIYVCDIICDEMLDNWERLEDKAGELWNKAGEEHGGETYNCGWWEQTPGGHAQRMLALESIIRDLGGTPQ